MILDKKIWKYFESVGTGKQNERKARNELVHSADGERGQSEEVTEK